MAFYTVEIQFRNSTFPPFNWTDWWNAPALRRLNGSVQIRAVRLPVLLIELSLQSGWDYRVRTCCISMLKLRQRTALDWRGSSPEPESSSKCSESVACIVGNWSGTTRAADWLADGDWSRDENSSYIIINAPWKRSRLGTGPNRRQSHFPLKLGYCRQIANLEEITIRHKIRCFPVCIQFHN